MLYKRGNECLITTMPSDLYPVDGALKAKEIVDVLEEEDSHVQHSVLFDDEEEMTEEETSSLKRPILEECSSATSRTPSTIRRVREEKVTDEQAANLTAGGVVFLPQKSNRGCALESALTQLSEDNCWYWPNPETGARVSGLHNIIHMVGKLTCCVNTPGAPCCDTTYPNHCLCDEINTKEDFKRCLNKCVPGECSFSVNLGEQRILCETLESSC